MKDYDDNYIKKLLHSFDFSKGNPTHKERLRRELIKKRNRRLSDDDLDFVSAAGDLDASERNINENPDDLIGD